MPLLASTAFCFPTQPRAHPFTVNLPVHSDSIAYIHIHTFSILTVIIFIIVMCEGVVGGEAGDAVPSSHAWI